MGSLLQDLAQEGVRDSSGVFSLDPAMAIRKLAMFQQAEPAQFLSLLVQAAVSSGAPSVHVKFRDGGVRVHWVPDEEHREKAAWSVLPERLQSPEIQALEQPPDYVVAALQASLALDPLAAGWSIVTPEASWAVMVTDEGLVIQEGPGADPEIRFSLRVRLEGNFFQRLKQRLTGHAEWHFSMIKRCGSCPVPIFVDGRRINWPLRGPSTDTMTSIRSGLEDGLEKLRAERYVLGSEPRARLLLAASPATRRFHYFGLGGEFPIFTAVESVEFLTNFYRADLFELHQPAPEDHLFPRQSPPTLTGKPIRAYSGEPPELTENLWGVSVWPREVRLTGSVWIYTLTYDQTCDPGYNLLNYPPLLVHAIFSLDRESTEPGKVIVVQWGVALDPITVDLGAPGALAIVAWQGKTDLSRLRPLQDECFRRLVDSCRRHFQEMQSNLLTL